MAEDGDSIRENVKEYYGKRLSGSKDLRTSACCCSCGPAPEVAKIIPLIDEEILGRFYGCGSPIPLALDGLTVLDLGCGSGRDAFLLSKLVGKDGHVIGIDMTPEQLDVAKSHIGSQTERFGFDEPNVDFRQGYIEDLASAGIEDDSVDVVVSNCVINLSPDKEKVFSEIRRVLKDGGELCFSDVFADRRLPKEVRDDPVLYGECLGGAMYTEDFRRIMRKAGFEDFRCMSESAIDIQDQSLRALVGSASFASRTIRAFKMDCLEDVCEDYGQTAIYKGNLEGHPDSFVLDKEHSFRTNEPVKVCGNTASMLSETRFRKYFTVIGDRSVHRGRFEDCGQSMGRGCCC